MPFPVYLDADVHPIVARILRGRGFDALSANEAGHRQASDQLEIGELVRRMTKVLGTYSASDMINRFVWLQAVHRADEIGDGVGRHGRRA